MKFRCLSYHIRSAFPLRVCFVKEKSRVKKINVKKDAIVKRCVTNATQARRKDHPPMRTIRDIHFYPRK